MDTSGLLDKQLEYQALGMSIQALEQEPTTKNDLGVDAISRADARSLICNTDIKHHMSGMSRKVFKDLYNGMDELPSVTPQEPKTGHWIDRDVYDADRWKCSECGRTEQYQENFCPNCGAKMVESQESEVKDGNN